MATEKTAKRTLALALIAACALTFAVTGLWAWQTPEGDEDSFVHRAHRGLHGMFQSLHGQGHGHQRHHDRGHQGREHHSHGGAHHEEHLEQMMAHVEETLNLGPDQAYAWEELQASLRVHHGTFFGAWGELRKTGDFTAPTHLAAVEQLLTRGLEVVREVRPTFDAFYDVLTEEQRHTIDEILAAHHWH